MIINLISGPRNVSTALMYSFAQRTDTRVWDEPFYAVYLHKSGAPHPAADVVMRTLPNDENKVRSAILSADEPVQFLKNMAHHMELLDNALFAPAKNIFLIRDPRQILASYAEVIATPVMRDIGIAYQYNLFSRLKEDGMDPLVLDAGALLENPGGLLKVLCERCELNYEQRMEHWPPGPKPYDGVWARHWYANVHSTTGFQKQTTSSRALPHHLDDLLSEARSIYEKLLPFSLNA